MICVLSLTVLANSNPRKYGSENSYDYIVDLASDTSVLENDDLKTLLLNKTRQLINTGKVRIHINEFSYDYNNSILSEVSSKEYFSLTIPVVGNTYSVLSNLTIIFDGNFLPVSYSELILTESTKETFNIQIYTDGIKTYSEVTDIEYIRNSEMNKWLDEMQTVYDGVQPYALDLPCFGAVTGAGAAISGLLVKVCGGPCTLAPPICAVCVGGIIIVGGGSIIAAVTQCWS